VAVPLVQLSRTPSAPSPGQPAVPATPIRKPAWLKVRTPGGQNYVEIRGMMRELGLHTVC